MNRSEIKENNRRQFILIHNRPSRDPEPSLADQVITGQVYRAGLLLKIDPMDHLIIGPRRNGYASKSLRELGYFSEYEYEVAC